MAPVQSWRSSAVAGTGDRLAQHPDPGVAGAYFDGLGDEGVGGFYIAAAQRRLRLGQVLVGLPLVQRRLRLRPQLVRADFVFVDGAGAITVLDRLLVEAGLERLGRRRHVLRDLLLADAIEDAVLAGPGRRPRRAHRRVRASRPVLGLDARVLARRALVAFQAPPHPRQVAVHRRQVGIATAGILLQRLGDDLLDLGVGIRNHLLQPRRRLLGDPSEHAVPEAAREGLLVAEQLEHDRAAREDVGAVVDGQAAHLLRRHVVEAADQGAGVGDAGIGQLGDAEVEDLQAAAPLLDHQVGRLDVAMDDAEAVRVGEPVAQLLEQAQLADQRGRLLAPDPHRQRLAVDVLHGDEGLAVLLADVEDADDVLVLEHTGGVRLLHEAAPDLVVVDAFLEQLDGDRAAADLGIAGAQERAHPARTDRADDLVATDGVGNCHGRRQLYVAAGAVPAAGRHPTSAPERAAARQAQAMKLRAGFR
jgi:hypothetical protein